MCCTLEELPTSVMRATKLQVALVALRTLLAFLALSTGAASKVERAQQGVLYQVGMPCHHGVV